MWWNQTAKRNPTLEPIRLYAFGCCWNVLSIPLLLLLLLLLSFAFNLCIHRAHIEMTWNCSMKWKDKSLQQLQYRRQQQRKSSAMKNNNINYFRYCSSEWSWKAKIGYIEHKMLCFQSFCCRLFQTHTHQMIVFVVVAVVVRLHIVIFIWFDFIRLKCIGINLVSICQPFPRWLLLLLLCAHHAHLIEKSTERKIEQNK